MNLQSILIIMGLFSSLFGNGQKTQLSSFETGLMKKLNFRTDVLTELKALTKNDLKQLPAIDEETGDILVDEFFNGVYSEATEINAIEYVRQLRTKFKSKGYLAFVFEAEDNKKYIAVIKGTDELDILRYRRTNGINYGLENEHIVKQVSEWKTKYGITVIGCALDWLHVEFDKMPTDLNKFAKEVYKFCPDSVDQGVGTIEALQNAIKEMNGVWLWWD